jgi:hypothetical protein
LEGGKGRKEGRKREGNKGMNKRKGEEGRKRKGNKGMNRKLLGKNTG